MERRRPLIMGVVNLTSDSFSGDGVGGDVGLAVERVAKLIADGADVIDLGAESTRPGAASLDAIHEWLKLEPVLARLAKEGLKCRLSIDTRHSDNMIRAAEAGVEFINCVAGLADAVTLRRLGKRAGLNYVAMHMHGTPATMQDCPLDGEEALTAVGAFFESSHQRLLDAGFPADRIWLDPGVGFGKTDAANVQIMGAVSNWSERFRIVVGTSRKSWIGRVLGIDAPQQRDDATKMVELGLMWNEAAMIRTHDVAGLAKLRRLLCGR